MKKDNLTYTFLSLRDKLHRSAMSFLRNDEDAKDVLQDTFFSLWKAGNVATDIEARNKLFTVLRNLCIDRIRKPRTIELPDSISDSLKVEADYEDIEKLENLLSDGLTDIQRKIYSLVVHHGIEYEEIAAQLGMTVEAVRMNMSRARKRIRDNYKQLDR